MLAYTTVKQPARVMVSRMQGSVVVVMGLLPPPVTGSAGIVRSFGGCSFAGGFPAIHRRFLCPGDGEDQQNQVVP